MKTPEQIVKPGELRIGNWILKQADSDKQPEWRPTMVNLTYLSLVAEFPERYRPVRLTPEWLEQLGFTPVLDGKDHSLNRDGIGLYYTREFGEMGIHCKYSSGPIPVKIEYVHQLQNLYHALTGAELNTKEK